MWSYIKDRANIFYHEMLCSPGILITIGLFILIKMTTNLYYGANILIAVRSGILGCLFYLFGYFIIALFAVDTNKIPRENIEVQGGNKNRILLIVLAYSLFLLLRMIDYEQRTGYIGGIPLLTFLPGYSLLMQFIDSKIAIPISHLAACIHPMQVGQIVKGFLFSVFIPYLIFRKLGYTFKGRIFSMRNSRAAWPIILVYVLWIATKGFRIEGIWYVAYAFLHPALQEEFFDRGIILPILSRFFKNTGNVLVVGTLVFTLLHFPDLYFRQYHGDLLMTIGQLSTIMITGILYAYGYRKTGSLLPMMIVHALEDALFLF